MEETTWYRRPLPDGQIPYSSAEGRQLFREALASGGMDGGYALWENFHTQAEPAFCSLGTLVVVLNALQIDPGRLWKGPWRWFSEEMLDGCVSLDHVRKHGLTLDELACIARCNGATTEVTHADRSSIDAFRAALTRTATHPEGPFLVAAYSRKVMGQTGEGHFSPIAGWHPSRDLVLILDVARFKYPPHWVPVERLWLAMQAWDAACGEARGWMFVGKGPSPAPVTLRIHPSGKSAFESACGALLARLTSEPPEDAVTAVRLISQALAPVSQSMVSILPASGAPEHQRSIAELIHQLSLTTLYARVAPYSTDPTATALAFYLLPDAVFNALPPDVRSEVRGWVDPAKLSSLASSEVCRMQVQATFMEAGAKK